MNLAVIAVVLGILGVVIPVVVARRGRPVRRLDYRAVSDRALARGAYVGPNSLEILAGDSRPAHPRIVTVRLACSGTEALRAEDFRGPVRLLAKPGIHVLAAGATHAPSGAEVDVHAAGDEVTIRPLSLDRGEWIELEVHVDGLTEPAFAPIAHTVGVAKRIGRVGRRRIAWRPWTDG